jgi:hypothetical protein
MTNRTLAVIVLGGTGVVAVRAQDDTACERYPPVVEEVERAERAQGDMTFGEAQRKTAASLAACMQEEAATAP